MDKIEFKKAENLKAGFKKAGIHRVNREKLIERLAEHKSDMLDNDLIGKAFLDQIQNEGQDFIGLAGKPRKKKFQVSPGDSLSIEDLRKSRDNPEPSTLKPTRNKKKGQVLSSSSSESDSIDFDLASDSDNLDDGSDSEDVNNLIEPDDGSDSEDVNNLVEPNDNLEEPEQNYKVDDFVLVKFQEKQFPGCITKMFNKGPTMDCMEKLSKQWRWPAKKNCIDYEWRYIIAKIKTPILYKRNFFLVPELNEFM
jgi:hypothetical protein